MDNDTSFYAIVESLDDCIVIVDRNHLIRYANPAFCDIVERPVEAFSGASFTEVLQKNGLRFDDSLFEKNGSSPQTSQVVCYWINSVCQWYEWRVKPFRGAGRNPEEFLIVGKNITSELLRVEPEIESFEQYRQFIMSQQVAMFRAELDEEGRLLVVNSAMADLFGYSSLSELLKSNAISVNLSKIERKQLLQRLLEEETLLNQEMKGRKSDGSDILVAMSLQLVRDSAGHPIAVDGIIEDITEKTQIEKSLRFYKFVFDHAAVGIFQMNYDGRILNVNSTAAENLGYGRDDLIGKHITEIDIEMTVEDWKVIWNSLQESQILSLERIHRKNDGSVIPVEIMSNQPVYEGKQYSIAFIKDISSRKKIEEALSTSERLHREAQKIAKLGHWERCIESNEILWSDEVYDIFGVVKEDCSNLYEAVLERVHPEDVAHHFEMVKRTRTQGEETDFSYRIILPDETVKYLHVMARCVFNKDGSLKKTVGTIQDITARRLKEIEWERTEKRLLQVQKLEAVGTLAGGIAHDFNNILTSIIGFTQIAKAKLTNDHAAAEKLQYVLDAGIRARELVAHILDFSRQKEQVFEPVSLELIVKEVSHMLRASLPANINLRRVLSPSVCKVWGVPIQLHQILVNLCTNAFQAIGKSAGVITVSLDEVEVTSHDFPEVPEMVPGKYARLSVSDNGQGIDHRTLDKIFDPYFTTKPKEQGTGLGLSVVHGIVNRHKGAIRTYSELGKGSSFFIYLPCTKMEKNDKLNRAGESVVGGSEHILIVDDEPKIIEAEKELLNSLGYRVTIFSKPADAIAYFNDNFEEVDLVITDMTMPEIDGVGMARSFHQVAPHLPVILQTGFSEDLYQDQIQHMNFAKIVKKPLLFHELAQCVRQTLDAYGGLDT